MTEQPTDNVKEKTVETSVGEVLRQAREANAFSVTYVSAHTHLKEEVIFAIENDDHDRLPSPVFVKGYIRSYAKLLEVDIENFLGDYSKESIVERVSPEIKKPKKVRSSGADPVVIWSSVTVVALLLGLLTTWWLHKDDSNPVELASVVEQFDGERSEPDNSQSNDEESSHHVGLGSVDPKHISDTQNASVDIHESQEQEVELVEESQINATEAPVVIESPLSGGDIEKVRITVRYTQESWTEIFDARKRRLLHGLIKPGATRVISGQAPFNVFLGNSPGVELEINGKPFDHSVYMRRNNTARFLIDDINS